MVKTGGDVGQRACQRGAREEADAANCESMQARSVISGLFDVFAGIVEQPGPSANRHQKLLAWSLGAKRGESRAQFAMVPRQSRSSFMAMQCIETIDWKRAAPHLISAALHQTGDRHDRDRRETAE